MVDWTVVLTALFTALATLSAAGVTAYFGFRGIAKSTEVTRKQMEEETNRSREQIEGENERLRAQHREDHLRNRQSTYHVLLSADREYTNAILLRQDPRPKQQPFYDAAMGVLLFGSPASRDAMDAVIAEYGEVFDYARNHSTTPGTVTADELLAAWQARSKQMNGLKDELLRAMRADVEPR